MCEQFISELALPNVAPLERGLSQSVPGSEPKHRIERGIEGTICR
jgi:hypothetical protein